MLHAVGCYGVEVIDGEERMFVDSSAHCEIVQDVLFVALSTSVCRRERRLSSATLDHFHLFDFFLKRLQQAAANDLKI